MLNPVVAQWTFLSIQKSKKTAKMAAARKWDNVSAVAWLTSNLISIIAIKNSVGQGARMLVIIGITKIRRESFAISKKIPRYKSFFHKGVKVVMRHVRISMKIFSLKTHLMALAKICLFSSMIMNIGVQLEISKK
jgi:hypothetical protein